MTRPRAIAPNRRPHVVALVATYNERRFVDACLEHLDSHDIAAYLIDNCSTDGTVELAERWLGRNLIGIETFSRKAGDVYDWRGILQRKEVLARELDADWFMHLDPDEIRLPPTSGPTLVQALETVDREGFNAVDFVEFTFVPTVEAPDHDHHAFQQTLRTYYAYQPPRSLHQLKAWKANSEVELRSGGHTASFPGLKAHPRQFRMKHYLFLSVAHAIEKYGKRRYDPDEVASGWHGWRTTVGQDATRITLPRQQQLRMAQSDDDLDPSSPRRSHWLESCTTPPPSGIPRGTAGPVTVSELIRPRRP